MEASEMLISPRNVLKTLLYINSSKSMKKSDKILKVNLDPRRLFWGRSPKKLIGVVSGWERWAKHTPSHSTNSYTVTKPKLDIPTKLQPNWMKIARIDIGVVLGWVGFAKPGGGSLKTF